MVITCFQRPIRNTIVCPACLLRHQLDWPDVELRELTPLLVAAVGALPRLELDLDAAGNHRLQAFLAAVGLSALCGVDGGKDNTTKKAPAVVVGEGITVSRHSSQ